MSWTLSFWLSRIQSSLVSVQDLAYLVCWLVCWLGGREYPTSYYWGSKAKHTHTHTQKERSVSGPGTHFSWEVADLPLPFHNAQPDPSDTVCSRGLAGEAYLYGIKTVLKILRPHGFCVFTWFLHFPALYSLRTDHRPRGRRRKPLVPKLPTKLFISCFL